MKRELGGRVLPEGRTIRNSRVYVRTATIGIAAVLTFILGTSGLVLGGRGYSVADSDGDVVHCVPDASIDPTCDDGHATVQAAVTHAEAGETVLVGAGTYTEQVTIGTNGVTLESVVPWAATIKAPASMADPKAIVRVNGATGVTIEDLTIAGPGDGGCNSLRYGIRVDGGGSATIEGNHVKDIRDDPFSGCQNGVGILVGRFVESTTGTAHILYNTIDGYQKGGIVVDNTGSSATITGNVIEGATPTVVTAQNGIQVSRGATASVTLNEVTGNWYSGADWTATGILIFESDLVSVETNIVVGSQVGVAIESWDWDVSSASDNDVVGNIITGSEWGVTVAAVAWDPYSGGNPVANDNLVDSNVITGGSLDVGVAVYVLDASASYDPTVSGNVVSGNTVNDATTNGIELTGAVSGAVDGNTVSGSGTYGIRLQDGSDGNVVSANVVDASGTADISVADSDGTLVEDNVLGDTVYGVYVAGSSGSTSISGNNVAFADTGILVDVSGTSTSITSNTVSYSDADGIYLRATDASAGAVVELNLVDASEEVGIHVEDSQDTVVSENMVSNSRVDGILAEDSNLDVTDNEVWIDDDGMPAPCDELNGIRFYSSTGLIHNNVVTGIHCEAVGSQASNGIGLMGTTSADVTYNTVTDFGKRGIVAGFWWDSVADVVTAHIEHNTVTGWGPVGVGYAAQNGIQMNEGSSGWVKSNTVNDVFYTGPSWAATGILLWDPEAGIEVGSNDVNDAQTGIYVYSSDDSWVHDNTVDGATWGIGIDTETGALVEDNTVGTMAPSTGWTSYGIEAWADTDGQILNNHVSGGYDIGIAVEAGSHGTLVQGNTVSGNFKFGVLVDDSGASPRIVVEWNTITGTPTGIPGSGPLHGILIRDSDADVQYNAVSNIHRGGSGANNEIGIAIDGLSDANVLYNVVTNYGKGGIYAGLFYDGTGDDAVTADIVGNTVVGRGHITDVAQNGIASVDGSSANIDHNMVFDNFYTQIAPPDNYWGAATATGILDYMTPGAGIENNTVVDNQAGIATFEANSQVYYNRVSGSQWGIALEHGCSACVVAYNIVTAPSSTPADDKTGILVADDDTTLVAFNFVTSYAIGIFVGDNPNEAGVGSAGTLLRNNTVLMSTVVGVRIEDSSGIGVWYNTMRKGADGMIVQDSSGVFISHNHVGDNAHEGIRLDTGATDSTVDHNTVTGNVGDSGIYVRGTDNSITYNVVSSNGWGISVDGSWNYIARNTVNNNDHYGLWAMAGSHDNTFTRNTVRNNGDVDCVDDGTGNHWIRNNCGTTDLGLMPPKWRSMGVWWSPVELRGNAREMRAVWD